MSVHSKRHEGSVEVGTVFVVEIWECFMGLRSLEVPGTYGSCPTLRGILEWTPHPEGLGQHQKMSISVNIKRKRKKLKLFTTKLRGRGNTNNLWGHKIKDMRAVPGTAHLAGPRHWVTRQRRQGREWGPERADGLWGRPKADSNFLWEEWWWLLVCPVPPGLARWRHMGREGGKAGRRVRGERGSRKEPGRPCAESAVPALRVFSPFCSPIATSGITFSLALRSSPPAKFHSDSLIYRIPLEPLSL